MFARYALRTTDLAAARTFYKQALGLELPDGMAEGSDLEAWPLHERAIAAGAPAHWLGQLAVDDVDATLSKLVERGSQALGPVVRGRDGTPFATVRDPFGSVIGVRASTAPKISSMAWHQLHTADADGAWALYNELFGWVHEQTIEVPKLEGGLRLFAWRDGNEVVGGVGNTGRWPGVHAHWLFHLPVDDLEAALVRVRAHGGKVLEPFVLPSGMRVVACDDPQGAAFGLAQRG